MRKLDRLVSQGTSGRWLLTVLAGMSFAAFSIVLAYVIAKQRAEFKPETLVAMFSALLLVVQGVYKDFFHNNGDTSSDIDSSDIHPQIQPPIPPMLPPAKP